MKFNHIIKGTFEVYSVISNEALSKPMDFDAASDEIEAVAVGAGVNGFENGAVSIRRVRKETA